MQFTSVELLQEAPVVGQLGTLGQMHLLLGKLPAHTRPDWQAAVVAVKQPLLSSLQVTTAPVPVSQYDPGEPDWQAVTAGQAQPAEGALPTQVCGEAQALVAVVVRQPLTIAQVTTEVEPAAAQTVPA